MNTGKYILFIAGLTLFAGLLGYHGFADVVATVAVCGWGLIGVTLFRLLPMTIFAAAWQILIEEKSRPTFRIMLWVQWIGESVKTLLPVAQVGGDLVKARVVARSGVSTAIAGASIVVDITVSVATQIIFAVIGVILLMETGSSGITTASLIGIGAMTAMISGFYVVQRRGLFRGIVKILSRFTENWRWQLPSGGAGALDAAILDIYQKRWAVFQNAFWRLTGLAVGAGEVWLALYFLGVSPNWRDALLLESLGQAIRSAGFLIPGALGVQEGGYLLLGNVIGLTPEISLALSLTRRVRVLLLGLPGLVAWQIAEGRYLRISKVPSHRVIIK